MVKFLIIRFSSIGDIVLTTPVIRCIKNQVKDSEVHYLTKKQYSSILENNPYIDKLWQLDKNFKTIISDLQKEKFDYVIDLHHNLRTLRIKNKLKVIFFSFKKLNIEKWLMVNLKINRLPKVHIVDRYLDTVRLFDVKNDNEGLDYFLSEEDEKLAPEISSLLEKEFIVLSIGALHKTKKAPVSKWAEICNKLNIQAVILGGETDIPEAGEIVKLSTNRNILDLTGKLSLNKSAYVIKQSKLVITHDTGLMHIASAFKKIIISIWGNTIPEFGMYPYMADKDSKMFEVKGLDCRPCSKLGFESCPREHFRCMLDQNTDEISDFIKRLNR